MKNKTIMHNVDAHNKVAKSYDGGHPEIYNDFEQTRLSNVIDDLLSRFSKKNVTVLDFGSGTGNLTIHFLNKNCKVTALDISKKSLDVLEAKIKSNNLKTVVFDGLDIPFEDNSFDVVCTYSVLHHVPDYLHAVDEMCRILKKGGIIYIDHEGNAKRWKAPERLKEYYKKSKPSKLETFFKYLKNGSFLSLVFYKTLFMKVFVNKRFRMEGDLHVWPDDHIVWNDIYKVFEKYNIELIREEDFLMYHPKGGDVIHDEYSKEVTDTKFVFGQKK